MSRHDAARPVLRNADRDAVKYYAVRDHADGVADREPAALAAAVSRAIDGRAFSAAEVQALWVVYEKHREKLQGVKATPKPRPTRDIYFGPNVPRWRAPSTKLEQLSEKEALVVRTIRELCLKCIPGYRADFLAAAQRYTSIPDDKKWRWWSDEGEAEYESVMNTIFASVRAYRDRGAPLSWPPIEHFWYWVAMRQQFESE